MKKKLTLISLLIFITSSSLLAQFVEYRPYQSQSIKNAWYVATIKYSNLKTNKESTYTLNVKVESNRVTMIDFGDGGSLHSGMNNEGYIYSGGNLFFELDSNNNVNAARTTVTITGINIYTTWKIRIE